MPKLINSIVDPILKRIQRNAMYYRRFNNTLDPRTNINYTRFAKECAKQYAKENPGTTLGPSAVHTEGMELVRNAFPKEEAMSYSDKITKLIQEDDPAIVKKDPSGLSVAIQNPLVHLGDGLLDVLRNEEVNRGIEQFFKGYYRIKWVVCYRSVPCDRPASSWLWHSDSFPPHTGKLFLHLTPATAETGAMEMMNLEDTMAYRDAGYFGQHLDERYDNLEEFAKEHNLPYNPYHFDANPGDATIFDMNFFHRAVAPRKDFRDVIQFFFMPSMIPWEEQLKIDGIENLGTTGNVPKDPRKDAATAATAM